VVQPQLLLPLLPRFPKIHLPVQIFIYLLSGLKIRNFIFPLIYYLELPLPPPPLAAVAIVYFKLIAISIVQFRQLSFFRF
jgi:hypothetical protein